MLPLLNSVWPPISGHPARDRGGLDGQPRVARARGATDAVLGLRPHLPGRARRRHRRKVDDNVHDITGEIFVPNSYLNVYRYD